MKDLVQRLRGIGSTISKICEISGTPGVAIGVIHQNEVIHTAGYGYRDLAQKLAPDQDTVFHLASLSKAFTAAAISMVVEENKVDWNDRVTSILPGFWHEDITINNESTLLDFLSHRTGLATKNALWLQDGTEPLLEIDQTLPQISYLETVQPLRSTWLYSNWGYCITAKIIEHSTGKSWGDFLSENIFVPLGLSRTFTEQDLFIDNVAESYIGSSDGIPFHVERPAFAAGSIMQGAVGVKSTVRDLLKFYKALLTAWKHQSATNTTSTPGSPFKDIRYSLTGHMPLNMDDRFDQSYGVGWVVSEIPAPLGQIGLNGMYVSPMPTVGKGSKKRKVWHHNGSLVGQFSSVHVLPETDTAIIVLTNAVANSDSADWIGQLLLETVIDNEDQNDYFQLASDSASAFKALWHNVKTTLDNCRIPNTRPRPLENYEGRYFNKVGNWFIEVAVVNGELEFSFQGRPTQSHKLQHYNYDTFCWLMSEEESIHRGRWPDLMPSVYLFKFSEDKDDKIEYITWVHDYDVPSGEIFSRTRHVQDTKAQLPLGEIDTSR